MDSGYNWENILRRLQEAEYLAAKYYFVTQIVIIALILSLWLIFRSLRREKRLWYHYNYLSYSARSKLHNIRNNYTAFIDLIDNKKFNEVQQYAEKSAYYYSSMLNEVEADVWTIEMEMDLLNSFYEAEKLIYGDVTILSDFNNIDIQATLFIPDVFTTLLQNSMKHAFKDKVDEHIFTIDAIKKGKILFFEVSDNGNPSTKKYQKRKDSGLYIFEGRLFNKFRIAKMKKHISNCLVIEKGPDGIGTKVKFKYPYELPT